MNISKREKLYLSYVFLLIIFNKLLFHYITFIIPFASLKDFALKIEKDENRYFQVFITSIDSYACAITIIEILFSGTSTILDTYKMYKRLSVPNSETSISYTFWRVSNMVGVPEKIILPIVMAHAYG